MLDNVSTVKVKKGETVVIITSFGKYNAHLTVTATRAETIRQALIAGAWAYLPKREGQASTPLTYIRPSAILGIEF